MKYSFYVIMALLLWQAQAVAQRKTGSYLVGASLADISFRSVSIGDNGKSRSQSFSLQPMVGRFFTPDILGGAALNIQLDHSRNDFGDVNHQDEINNGSTLGLELFGRKYFGSLSANAWPYVQAAAGYERQFEKHASGLRYTDPVTPSSSYSEKGSGHSSSPAYKFTLLGGGTILLNRFVGLDMSAGFQFSSVTLKSSYTDVITRDDGTTHTIEVDSHTKTNRNAIIFNIGMSLFLSRLGKEK